MSTDLDPVVTPATTANDSQGGYFSDGRFCFTEEEDKSFSIFLRQVNQ
jgi:hypothetical protein